MSNQKLQIEVPSIFTKTQAEKILAAADQLNAWRHNGPLLAKCSVYEAWVTMLSSDTDTRLNLHSPDEIWVDMKHILALLDACNAKA